MCAYSAYQKPNNHVLAECPAVVPVVPDTSDSMFLCTIIIIAKAILLQGWQPVA